MTHFLVVLQGFARLGREGGMCTRVEAWGCVLPRVMALGLFGTKRPGAQIFFTFYFLLSILLYLI